MDIDINLYKMGHKECQIHDMEIAHLGKNKQDNPYDLQQILDLKYKAFNRTNRMEQMRLLEYFSSCKLFEEIAQGLDDLHNRSPPIIHRDLKPANILISKSDKGRFLEIYDLGLTTDYHETQTKGIGTTKYMAPELNTDRYNTKADIYSFGIIAQELFDVDCITSDFDELSVHADLKWNFKILYNLITEMIKTKYRERPDVAKILDSLKLWRITAKEMSDKLGYCVDQEVSKLKSFENNFFYDFITTKINLERMSESMQENNKIEQDKININGKENNDKFHGIFLQNGRFKGEFIAQPSIIAVGTHGIVIKAKNSMDNNYYAIKQMIIRDKKDYDDKMTGLKVWAAIDNDYFVEYHSHWVEKYIQKDQDKFLMNLIQELNLELNSVSLTDFKNEKKVMDFALLHIQMDFCSLSLREVLKEIKTYFNLNTKQLLTDLQYYISSELLLEILEAIDYLHTSKPPILHRNIKPENILINQGTNGKFVKIGDFGMAVFHEYPEISHTQMRGTIRYMAPEVMTSRKYDTKADIYSIGVMIQELFNFDINSNPPENIPPKYEKIIELTGKAMNGQRKARPDCRKFIELKQSWSIDYNKVKGEIISNIDVNKRYDLDNEFVQTFLKAKYDLNGK